jgi:hypothetical protein
MLSRSLGRRMPLKRSFNNTYPPYLGPTWPIYPKRRQLVRISGPKVGPVWPCFVQQFAGNPPAPRDREPAWICEPNGLNLGGGRVVALLSGRAVAQPRFPHREQRREQRHIRLYVIIAPRRTTMATKPKPKPRPKPKADPLDFPFGANVRRGRKTGKGKKGGRSFGS